MMCQIKGGGQEAGHGILLFVTQLPPHDPVATPRSKQHGTTSSPSGSPGQTAASGLAHGSCHKHTSHLPAGVLQALHHCLPKQLQELSLCIRLAQNPAGQPCFLIRCPSWSSCAACGPRCLATPGSRACWGLAAAGACSCAGRWRPSSAGCLRLRCLSVCRRGGGVARCSMSSCSKMMIQLVGAAPPCIHWIWP
jgi:hypothetical protein